MSDALGGRASPSVGASRPWDRGFLRSRAGGAGPPKQQMASEKQKLPLCLGPQHCGARLAAGMPPKGRFLFQPTTTAAGQQVGTIFILDFLDCVAGMAAALGQEFVSRETAAACSSVLERAHARVLGARPLTKAAPWPRPASLSGAGARATSGMRFAKQFAQFLVCWRRQASYLAAGQKELCWRGGCLGLFPP